MRIVITASARPRPELVTPPKGKEGDLTDETQARLCDLDNILRRYAGNLAELMAWRGRLDYGEQLDVDLQSVFDKLQTAHDSLADLPDCPFDSLDDAFAAIRDGSFMSHFAPKTNQSEVKTHEASESQPENK